MTRFSTPKGTQDIMPRDWPYWTFVTRQAEDVARLFGYRRIETPTFAETALFARTTGEGTDIVDKEMYSFDDRSGDNLTLRPEGTAPVMRAYLQHGMHKSPQPVKLFYIERIYRAENPQKGRLREHHQFGCEAIGVEDAYVDVELISLLAEFYRRIGLQDLTLHVNSIGDARCRPNYVRALVSYLRNHEPELAPTDQVRLQRNPLRVLDSKEHASQPVVNGAPSSIDHLCEECRLHWNRVLHGLEVLQIEYQIDRRLVRGLDYYTRTVFEFLPRSAGAQAVVGAGGRYDALSEAMGGPHVPGVGFGSGIERLILNLQEQGLQLAEAPLADVYVAHVGEGADDAALRLLYQLRQRNVAGVMSFGSRGLKAQLKAAANADAPTAVLAMEDELSAGEVLIRDMRSGEQRAVTLSDAADEVDPASRVEDRSRAVDRVP